MNPDLVRELTAQQALRKPVHDVHLAAALADQVYRVRVQADVRQLRTELLARGPGGWAEVVEDCPFPLAAVHPPQGVALGRVACQVPQEEPEDLRRVEQVLRAAGKPLHVLLC